MISLRIPRTRTTSRAKTDDVGLGGGLCQQVGSASGLQCSSEGHFGFRFLDGRDEDEAEGQDG
jgi:hypothetical protein